MVTATMTVEMGTTGATWDDITADVIAPLSLKFGIDGSGPRDRIASVGVCTFSLDNSARNSGGLVGYYSPLHANCRSTFGYGQRIKVKFTYNSTDFYRFYGKIAHIDPEPGVHGAHRTRVVVYDQMADLIDAELRNVTLQITQTEVQLITTLLAAIPTSAQPLATTYDSAMDSIPYAFDDLGAGTKAISVLSELAVSSMGYIYIKPDGTLHYENRDTRQGIAIYDWEFLGDMSDLVLPTTLDGAYNHVRVKYFPRTIDAAATTVLWSQTGVAPSIAASATVEIWGDYFNPNDPTVRIGGTAQVTPAATTDYTANTLADGSGTDKTAQLSVTATFFASTVKWSLTNNDAGTIYVTKLQCRGKGLYKLTPVTVESISTQTYGDRALNIELPYQSDRSEAKGIADYLLRQYESLENQVYTMTFNPHRSANYMDAALSGAIGELVHVTESVSGINAGVYIQSVAIDVQPPCIMRCTFGLAFTAYDGSSPW